MHFRYEREALRWAMQKICLIHTSVSSCAEAEALAAGLIEQKLCACVQMTGPGLSTYRWSGEVEQAEEYYLCMKTTLEKREKVLGWLQKQHPYALPELSWELRDSSQAYAAWVHAEVESTEDE